MLILAEYSFAGGKKDIPQTVQDDIKKIINSVDSSICKTKKSKEVTMKERMLYSPKALNKQFSDAFKKAGWKPRPRIKCEYSNKHVVDDRYKSDVNSAYREMDFVKGDVAVGVEVQFGKYAFAIFNVCAKMTIFKKAGIIKYGIEILPVKGFAMQMSSGVAYFEQTIWDLENRGVSNIDVPVLLLGIGDESCFQEEQNK